MRDVRRAPAASGERERASDETLASDGRARRGRRRARDGGTGTGTTARARDAVTVLKALAVMPCEAEIARRREARMDPWTRRATTSASDDEAEETRATKRGGKRAKSTTGKKASGGRGEG